MSNDQYAQESVTLADLTLSSRSLSTAQYPADVVLIGLGWAGWGGGAGFKDNGVLDYCPAKIILEGGKSEFLVRIVRDYSSKTEVRAGQRLKAKIGGAPFVVEPLPYIKFDNVKRQRLEYVLSGKVRISNVLQEEFESTKQLAEAKGFKVFCPATECSFNVARDDIEFFDGSGQPEIKLSRYQRILLRQHPPLEVSAAWCSRLNRLAEDGSFSREVELFHDVYKGSDSIDDVGICGRNDPISFEEEKKLMRILNATGFFTVGLVPLFEDAGEQRDSNKFGERILNKILSIYVGVRPLQLRVCRPYDIDETREVVRVSNETMNFLGISELDELLIRNGKRTAVVRAVAINDEDGLRQNSNLAKADSIDAVIGIPAVVRKNLGINGIGDCVFVERNARYVMSKVVNSQLLSAVAFLFTVVEVLTAFDFGTATILGLYLVFLPFVLYITLFGERARVN